MTDLFLKTAIALLTGSTLLLAGCENDTNTCGTISHAKSATTTETGINSADCSVLRKMLGVDIAAIEKRFNGATATAIPAQWQTDDDHADIMPPIITIGGVKDCHLIPYDEGEGDCNIDQIYEIYFTAFSETDEEAIYGSNEWNTGQELSLQLHWKGAETLYELPCILKIDEFVVDNTIVQVECSWPIYATTEWIDYSYTWHTPK
jgi:hypothetical protein